MAIEVTTREVITLNKTIVKDGVNIANMNARISSDLDEEINKTATILNPREYYTDPEKYLEIMDGFDELFERRKQEMFDDYHDAPTEEVVEETPTDPDAPQA